MRINFIWQLDLLVLRSIREQGGLWHVKVVLGLEVSSESSHDVGHGLGCE